MNNIIWIFGNSASGKETFINEAINKKLGNIFDTLGLSNSKLVKISASTSYIGQYDGDPIVEKRQLIIPQVDKAFKDKDVTALIKWQDVDEDSKIPKILYEKYPNIRHIIFYLHVESDILWNRVSRKQWWEDGMASKKEFLVDWVRDQKQYAKYLINQGFENYVLNSTNKDYQIIDMSIEDA
jgi:hypothetical protein